MSCVRPKGAFYLFPQTPIDDVEFCRLLADQKILAVPGRGSACLATSGWPSASMKR